MRSETFTVLVASKVCTSECGSYRIVATLTHSPCLRVSSQTLVCRNQHQTSNRLAQGWFDYPPLSKGAGLPLWPLSFEVAIMVIHPPCSMVGSQMYHWIHGSLSPPQRYTTREYSGIEGRRMEVTGLWNGIEHSVCIKWSGVEVDLFF